MARLTDNLISFWSLEEASGTRYDAHGTNDLTDNNTVTSAAGVSLRAAKFTIENNESLSIADNASISAGDIEFTWAFWVYLDQVPTVANYYFIAKWGGGGFRDYAVLYIGSLNYFRFDTDGGARSIAASTFGIPAAETWVFVVVWYDPTANTQNIQINNGTVNSLSNSSGIQDSTSPLEFGYNGGQPGDSRMDSVGLWKRILTADEKTWLYNSGNGRSYAGLDGNKSPSGGVAVGAPAFY